MSVCSPPMYSNRRRRDSFFRRWERIIEEMWNWSAWNGRELWCLNKKKNWKKFKKKKKKSREHRPSHRPWFVRDATAADDATDDEHRPRFVRGRSIGRWRWLSHRPRSHSGGRCDHCGCSNKLKCRRSSPFFYDFFKKLTVNANYTVAWPLVFRRKKGLLRQEFYLLWTYLSKSEYFEPNSYFMFRTKINLYSKSYDIIL